MDIADDLFPSLYARKVTTGIMLVRSTIKSLKEAFNL